MSKRKNKSRLTRTDVNAICEMARKIYAYKDYIICICSHVQRGRNARHVLMHGTEMDDWVNAATIGIDKRNDRIKELESKLKLLPHDEGRIITVGKPEPISFEKPADGVYIIFKTGQYVPFEKGADYNKEDVKYIGIVHDGHAFAIGLKDLGEYSLVKEGVKCPSDHPSYRYFECDALLDWEFVERTKHIQELGTDIPLAEGEYLPSLPMLVVMLHYRGEINEALESVGGEPFDKDSYYWSVTEGNSNRAWFVYFGSGAVSYNNKYSTSNVVRPVAAFNL